MHFFKISFNFHLAVATTEKTEKYLDPHRTENYLDYPRTEKEPWKNFAIRLYIGWGEEGLEKEPNTEAKWGRYGGHAFTVVKDVKKPGKAWLAQKVFKDFTGFRWSPQNWPPVDCQKKY